MQIDKVSAFQVYDSRGNPTVEAEVTLQNGVRGSAIVPSGASTGAFEALELRDQDPKRFLGRSVFKAVEHVNTEINSALQGVEITNQKKIDEIMLELDGTENKSRLGANAILGVSMAAASAAANELTLPLYAYLGDGNGNLLPIPEIQIFGGGAHSSGRIDVQDFMILCVGAETYEDCMEMTFNVYHQAGRLMKEKGKLAGLADEGGYWPVFDSNEEVFRVLLDAIAEAGYEAGKEVALSLDIAATEFYQDGKYHLGLEKESFSSPEFCDLMIQWCEKYPIISIEDPLAENDWEGWERFTNAMGRKVQIIGDDLFTTNIKRIDKGISRGIANSVLIKLNQIGTVTETQACIKRTQEANWLPVVSGRSGETEDTFIDHLAVATNAGQLKAGSFARSERTVKWNEVLRIQRQLGDEARFIGGEIYNRIID